MTGCTPTIVSPKAEQTKTNQLYLMVIKSNPQASKNEAMNLSKTAVSYSRALAKKYKVNTTPLIHNAMVNMGMRDRGLCFQWSDDLIAELSAYGFKTITVRHVGANINKFNEHNALVALPFGSTNLNQGILLDPWRHSGDLLFMPIKNDTKYKWSIRYR